MLLRKIVSRGDTWNIKQEISMWAVHRDAPERIDFCSLLVWGNFKTFYGAEIFKTKKEAKRYVREILCGSKEVTIEKVKVVNK